MSYWLGVFSRGETIVIPNIEDVKTLMPSEYELLKAQSIRSEIAVPVFYRGSLSGFFGLDNPQRTLTDNKLRLLAFVGGHLGSARENLRMLTLLEEKQKSLEQNLQAVKLEQQMLKVLCRHHVRLPRGSDERPGRDRQDRGALQLRGRPAPTRAIMRRLQSSGRCTG